MKNHIQDSEHIINSTTLTIKIPINLSFARLSIRFTAINGTQTIILRQKRLMKSLSNMQIISNAKTLRSVSQRTNHLKLTHLQNKSRKSHQTSTAQPKIGNNRTSRTIYMFQSQKKSKKGAGQTANQQQKRELILRFGTIPLNNSLYAFHKDSIEQLMELNTPITANSERLLKVSRTLTLQAKDSVFER